MYKLQQEQRSTVNEAIIILVKLVVCIILLYFNTNKPLLYTNVPFIGKVAYSLMIFAVASLSVSIIRFFIITLYIKRNKLKATIKDNFILGINQIVSVLNTVFIVISLMYFMGIDPIKFLTSITIVAAAIALVSKDYITNMINGLIIMFSDKLSLGDHIKVGDLEGKILDITLLNVVLQNEDNDMVLIPNSIIFTSAIINQSKQNIKKLNIEFEMELSNGYNPILIEAKLLPLIKDYEDHVMTDGFSVKTTEIKKDFARFKIQVLLKYHDKQKERELRRILNSGILNLSAVKRKSVE